MHGTFSDAVGLETANFALTNFPHSLLWSAFFVLKWSFIANFYRMKVERKNINAQQTTGQDRATDSHQSSFKSHSAMKESSWYIITNFKKVGQKIIGTFEFDQKNSIRE